MHIVTKILIVACAILSLLLSALAIAYTANAGALKSAFVNEKALKVSAEAAASHEIQSAAQRQTAYSERLQSLQNEVATRTSEAAKLQEERTGLRAELEKARSEAASIRGQIGQLGVTVDTQTAMIRNYRDEVTTLRDTLLQAQKREIELVDRVNELESAREVLQQNARALKEQLEESKLALQGAQAGAAAGMAPGRGVEGTPRELPGPLIQARVVDVRALPNGETLVVVDEGANRGIKKDALMHIVRGGEFIGSVVITGVEPTQSVGRVNTYNRTDKAGKAVTVQRDDVVISRLTS